MRSSHYCEFLVFIMSKVKRKRIYWVNVLHKVGNVEMFKYFFRLIGRFHHGKCLSSNRAAYSTLKHYYSTTTIAELCEKLGV